LVLHTITLFVYLVLVWIFCWLLLAIF